MYVTLALCVVLLLQLMETNLITRARVALGALETTAQQRSRRGPSCTTAFLRGPSAQLAIRSRSRWYSALCVHPSVWRDSTAIHGRCSALFAHFGLPFSRSSLPRNCASTQSLPQREELAEESRPGLGSNVRLRRGVRMPQLGLGTGKPGLTEGDDMDEEEGRIRLRSAVAAALQVGYRLVDTTLYSRTEPDIAAGIRMAGVERSDVFIATKLLQRAHESEEAIRMSLQDSLRNLDTNYVDLYMVHNPRAGRIKQVWPLLLNLREQGLIRVLGVSNFGVEQMEGMRLSGLELPEVNQVEVHCWRQVPELIEYHRRHNIATMCMSPLAKGDLFNKTDLASLAQAVGKQEAQVAIRWSLQNGFIPIPRSTRPERISSNAAEGFDLSDEDMARIRSLDEGYIACKTATPCHQLPWSLIADDVPDKVLWDDSKKRKAEAQARKAAKLKERAEKAARRQAEQMRMRDQVAAQRQTAAEVQ